MHQIYHILEHSLIDSLEIFLFTLIIYILFSFIEKKIVLKLNKKNRFSPIIASGLGLIPQCGFNIIAVDLYVKRHITMGTLISLFLACSDEALPILISQLNKTNFINILMILISKFFIGFIIGYLVDFIITKNKQKVKTHLKDCKENFEDSIHIGCCNHILEGEHKGNFISNHLWHPIKHSLTIFIYIFLINIIFNSLFLLIGENTLIELLNSNKYLTPIISTCIGAIPNCVSSVILTNTYLFGGLNFGAYMSGLLMNSGLGLIVLFKNNISIKEKFIIFLIIFFVSLFFGYLFLFI